MHKRVMQVGDTPCCFVADVHLNHESPERVETFFTWLESIQAPKGGTIPHLFILGDLFDFWFPGLAKFNPTYARYLDRFVTIAENVYIHFAGGNRDFHLVKAFRDRGLDTLNGAYILEFGSERIYASHGDELCVNDVGYQRYKRIIRSPPLMFLARSLPGPVKRPIVEKMAAGSRRHIEKTPDSTLEIPPEVYDRLLDQYDRVVHGHTHPEEGNGAGKSPENVVVLMPWQGPDDAYWLPRPRLD